MSEQRRTTPTVTLTDIEDFKLGITEIFQDGKEDGETLDRDDPGSGHEHLDDATAIQHPADSTDLRQEQHEQRPHLFNRVFSGTTADSEHCCSPTSFDDGKT